MNTDVEMKFKSTWNRTKVELTGHGPAVRKEIRTLRKVFCNRGEFSYQQIGNGQVFAVWGFSR